MRLDRLAAALSLLAATGVATAQPATLAKPVPAGSPAPSPAARIRLSSAELPVKDEEPAEVIFAADQIPYEPIKPPTLILPPKTMGTAADPILLADPLLVTDPAPTTTVTGTGPRVWASAEYLAWQIRKDSVPPLVGTGPAQFPVGFLNNPNTVVLFGGDLNQGTLSGVRGRIGCWLDECRTCGVELSGFALCQKTNQAVFSSDQFPVLTRPFTDVNPGGANAEFLAFPGISTGTITVEHSSQLYGAMLTGRCPICVGCTSRIDALAGIQCLNLTEQIKITETPRFDANAPFPGLAGVQFIAIDQFKTQNQFVGGVVGVDASCWYGKCSIGINATVAAGMTCQKVEVSGSQQAISPTAPTTIVPGGLLSVPGGNIGDQKQTQFSVVPQVGINLGYQLSANCQIIGGYSLLCWTNVARPGGQIDPYLDVNRIPNFGGGPPATANRPQIPFEQQTFWAQGVSGGIRFSW